MKKNRSLKQRLVSAVLVLVMAITSLIGTTFAWFTDIASSKNNVVQSGNLNAEMYWSDTLLSADSNQWKNANNIPVFTYDNWEPGYTDVKYIKISNEGNLSFKWRLTIEAAGGMTKLAEAIEVYYVNPVTSALTSVDGKTSAGLLSDVVTKKTSTSGALLPKNVNEEGYTSGYTVLAIALHMDETVGNKYKNISIGDGFELKLLATQFSYENDSFGNGYDEQAKWPDNTELGENSATAPVTPTADGKVPEGGVSLVSSDSKVAANVPAGVSLLTGASRLTLSVTDVEKSQANITLEETEASLSVDVHVSGIAEDNDVAIAVSIKELLPVGLNMGNYRFYHVENGVTVEMTLLTDGATPAHNNYEYDPATGDVVLYLKSFSEVALVADTVNAWNGTFANDFAGGEGTESNPYLIANADQLAYMSKIVSTDEAYAEAHYKLIADVNFGGDEVAKNDDKEKVFYPIGYWAMQEGTNSQGESYYAHGNSFSGTFDGNGNTISNIYQNTWLMDGNYDAGYWSAAMGLFGAVFDATIKNLTVDRFQSDGEFTPTGCVAAYAGGN